MHVWGCKVPLTIEELIEKSKDQRKRNKLEESLFSAMAAVEAGQDNADAWWQLGLSREALGDNEKAVPALRKTVELAPNFAYGWCRLGKALLEQGNEQEAKSSFEKAIDLKDEEDAFIPLSEIYEKENSRNQDELEIVLLQKIDAIDGLDSYKLNRLGNLYYRNSSYYDAIKYWRRDVNLYGSRASRFNIGLAYSKPSISQLADAIDTWRLTLKYHPDYEFPLQEIARFLPEVIDRKNKTRKIAETILFHDQWFSFYINPFKLIKADDGLDIDDFDPKTIKKLKEALLTEIYYEDGVVEWMDGLIIDKSRAISLCEELNDETRREWHWTVFTYKPLLDFLHKGSYEHFFVDKYNSPLEILEVIEEDEGFCDWLSIPFSKQFDLVLTNTLDAITTSPIDKELHLLRCLLDGRRWVSTAYEDKCFGSSRRAINELLVPLREISGISEEKAINLKEINYILENKRIAGILNLLPVYFNDYRGEAVSLIRNIAINCFKLTKNHKVTQSILELTNLFDYKSVSLDERLKEDFHTIKEISVNKLLTPLRKASDDAEEAIPDLGRLNKIIAFILDEWPDDFFEYEDEAVSLLREISVSCFNIHNNIDLSRSVLQLTDLFIYKSDSLAEIIKEDFKTIDNLIKEESKHEVKKKWDTGTWEITKKGVWKNFLLFPAGEFIPAADVSSIRWGSVATKKSYDVEYDFLLSIKALDGRVIVFNWRTSKNIDVSRGHFDDLLNATVTYLFPVVIARIEERLKKGEAVKIGDCRVITKGIEFETAGWFSKKTNLVPWHRVSTSIENGELTIKDDHFIKIKTSMSLRETENAVVLNYLVYQKKLKG